MTLPRHIDPSELVPDPSRRAGVWLHPDTDEVFAMPPDWTPLGAAHPVATPRGQNPSPKEGTAKAGIDAAPYTYLTRADLLRMNRGQMAEVATALGISGFDKMNKDTTTTAILDILAAHKAQPPAGETNVESGHGTGANTKDDPWATDLTGKDVLVLSGPYEGKIGVISETGGEGEDFALRVLIDGSEIPFASFEPELRFLTAEESAAAAEAAKAAAAAQ